MEPPSVVHHLPATCTSASNHHVDDPAANPRAAEAARVLRSVLQSAGLGRVAAHVATGRAAPTVWLLPIEPADARDLAALIGRALLVL
jgi:hypothetical protein